LNGRATPLSFSSYSSHLCVIFSSSSCSSLSFFLFFCLSIFSISISMSSRERIRIRKDDDRRPKKCKAVGRWGDNQRHELAPLRSCILLYVCVYLCWTSPAQPTDQPSFLFHWTRSRSRFFFFFFLIRAIVGMSTLFFSKFPYNYTHRPLSFFFHV
jgi:hypothetical protein